jgi:dihydrofolate synthase / folylpolyglutamate synthase
MFMTIAELEEFLGQYRGVDSVGGTLRPDIAIEKVEKFLAKIGNPHANLKVIHVAGTSGKGSIVTIASNILFSQGYKVGHNVSPHLIDFNERFQINCCPLSDKKLLDYFNQILPTINKFQSDIEFTTKYGSLSYFEIVTCLQFYIFAKEKVNYAILEVGMGGRYDATNVTIPYKVCVLSSIGLDHIKSLGSTREAIAYQKAGIIQPESSVIALSQGVGVNTVFETEAKLHGSEIDFVIPEFDFYNIHTSKAGTNFDFIDQELTERKISLSILGDYQPANTSLAIRAVEEIADLDDWEIDWNKLHVRISKISFVGRFSILKINDKSVIADGAHNEQKMSSFVSSLINNFSDKKFVFVIAFKKGKDYGEMIKTILKFQPNITKIIITGFDVSQDMAIHSIESGEVEKVFGELGYSEFEVVIEHQELLTRINTDNNNYVITGSLYLVGDILKHLK